MKPANRFVFVFVTAKTRTNALRIANALVQSKRAACVNLIPGLTSVYRWRGKQYKSREILLLIKTSKTKLAQVEKDVRRLHTYEVPEIVTVELNQSSQPYLKWLSESVR